jgi:polyhydroxybutyrate depolymerase
MTAKHMLLALALLAGAAVAGDVHHLTVDGRERTYRVYRPAGLDHRRTVPLVIMLHGGFGTGEQAEKSYGWDAEADGHGFIVAYPDGHRRSWNAGGNCCGPALRDNFDDVAFLTALIRTMEKSDAVDPRRVYLTGMSNGAAMSYRYACEGPLPVAAIGSVSGSFAYACQHPHPVSVMEIHGLDDRNIPFAGGHGSKAATDVQWLPVQASLDAFRDADVCNVPALEEKGLVVTSTAKCEKGREVVLITVAGAGHQWPGSRRPGMVGRLLGLDPPSAALDATDTLWNFFAHYSAP